ncbi:translesion error-prone DNA polymerase V autoproteolytic subunit [bacterium]|nr:translesion error-prone DNA polymerase V autoproteolytic subunit [bacterium]
MTINRPQSIIVLARAKGNGHSLPLATSSVQAGFATWVEDSIDRDLSLDDYLVEHQAATFLVRVAGESMIEAGILPGDVLVVDRSLQAQSGQIVIAVVDGDLLVKRLIKRGTRVELRAENQHFPPLVIPEGAQVEIWGVVTGVVRKLAQC